MWRVRFQENRVTLEHSLSGTVMLAPVLPIDGSDHSVSCRSKNWGTKVRCRETGRYPGVIVTVITVLLTGTFSYFRMFRYQVVLRLRKPLLMPALKPVPGPGISLPD